jgi:rubrerythrin
MAPVNLPLLLSVLKTMAENELALSAYYGACASASREDSAFFRGLAEMEERHADCIRKISDLIRSKPERFESGRPFNTSALQTILSYVKQNTSDVKEGRLNVPKSFHIAYDMEKSILESRYFEIVKSRDLEFQDLSSRIMKETFDHREALKRKIDALK